MGDVASDYVVIAAPPSNGTLYNDANSDGVVDGGEALSVLEWVPAADITAGRLKFKPVAEANGVGYDSFTFQVQDNGGTAGGGVDTDQTPNTMTIDVTSVNDVPVITTTNLNAVENLGLPHEVTPPAGVVTISAGVAALSPTQPRSDDPDNLLKEADAALYEAKKAGRNVVRTRDGVAGK